MEMPCVLREVRPESLFRRLTLSNIQQHLLDLTHSLNIYYLHNILPSVQFLRNNV